MRLLGLSYDVHCDLDLVFGCSSTRARLDDLLFVGTGLGLVRELRRQLGDVHFDNLLDGRVVLGGGVVREALLKGHLEHLWNHWLMPYDCSWWLALEILRTGVGTSFLLEPVSLLLSQDLPQTVRLGAYCAVHLALELLHVLIAPLSCHRVTAALVE